MTEELEPLRRSSEARLTPRTPRWVAGQSLALLVALSPSQGSHADYVLYGGSEERNDWIVAAYDPVTVTFTEYAPGTVITDQYAPLGVVFTDGDDFVSENRSIFPNDSHGLRPGGIDQFRMEFDQPMRALAIDFPGTVRFRLYYNGRLVFNHVAGNPGVGNFVGLAGPPFDVAVLTDPFGGVVIDDLHFGTGPITGDVNFDGLVDVDDLVQVILDWGACDEGCCHADTDFDDDVDVDDLVAVITNWT